MYIERDGLVLRGQHKKQLEIHRMQVYEGREKEGKRTRLIHAYHMASTEYEKTWERAGWYMHRQYGLSHTIVISNGDGGIVTKVFNAKLDVCRATESAADAGESPSDTARSV